MKPMLKKSMSSLNIMSTSMVSKQGSCSFILTLSACCVCTALHWTALHCSGMSPEDAAAAADQVRKQQAEEEEKRKKQAELVKENEKWLNSFKAAGEVDTEAESAAAAAGEGKDSKDDTEMSDGDSSSSSKSAASASSSSASSSAALLAAPPGMKNPFAHLQQQQQQQQHQQQASSASTSSSSVVGSKRTADGQIKSQPVAASTAAPQSQSQSQSLADKLKSLAPTSFDKDASYEAFMSSVSGYGSGEDDDDTAADDSAAVASAGVEGSAAKRAKTSHS